MVDSPESVLAEAALKAIIVNAPIRKSQEFKLVAPIKLIEYVEGGHSS